MRNTVRPTRNAQRGNAMVEMALIFPWIFFLCIGVYDFGFYAYSLICVQNAARVAVTQTSATMAMASRADLACYNVLNELKTMPNVGPSAACTCIGSSCTIGTAVTVTVPAPVNLGTEADPNWMAEVRITFNADQSMKMIPIPGFLRSYYTFTRSARMRI